MVHIKRDALFDLKKGIVKQLVYLFKRFPYGIHGIVAAGDLRVVAVSLHAYDLILIKYVDDPVYPYRQRMTRFRLCLQAAEDLNYVFLRHGLDKIMHGVYGKSIHRVFPAACDKSHRRVRTDFICLAISIPFSSFM